MAPVLSHLVLQLNRTQNPSSSSAAHSLVDGNQYAGLADFDDDGVPNLLDLFADTDDRSHVQELMNLLDPNEIDSLIQWGHLPNIYKLPEDYRNRTDEVILSGIDVGVPLLKAKKFSLWGYAQAAQVHDYGWGWSAPGLRAAFHPIEIGLEYRQYEKEFIGDYFDFSYELERAQVVGDSTYATKESMLTGLGKAEGMYGDLTLSFTDIGYLYAWALDMHGEHYPSGKTFYGEAASTPPQNPTKLRTNSQATSTSPTNRSSSTLSDGTIYGGKVFFGIAQTSTSFTTTASPMPTATPIARSA